MLAFVSIFGSEEQESMLYDPCRFDINADTDKDSE